MTADELEKIDRKDQVWELRGKHTVVVLETIHKKEKGFERQCQHRVAILTGPSIGKIGFVREEPSGVTHVASSVARSLRRGEAPVLVDGPNRIWKRLA